MSSWPARRRPAALRPAEPALSRGGPRLVSRRATPGPTRRRSRPSQPAAGGADQL